MAVGNHDGQRVLRNRWRTARALAPQFARTAVYPTGSAAFAPVTPRAHMFRALAGEILMRMKGL
jgi:hypothetical protein